MSVLGNPNNLATITEGDYTLSPFFTGPVTITNLSGAGFTVYGDYQDINFNLTGHTYSTSGTFNDLINNVSITLGGNHITLGGGVNTIYGALRDLTMSATGGSALGYGTTGVTVNTLIENTNIDLTGGGLGNTITAGNGVNTVYGDMRNYTITVGGASAINVQDPNHLTEASFTSSPNTQAFTGIQNLNFTVGGNHITLGNGVNTVYGDMQNLTISTLSNTAIGFNTFASGSVGDTMSFFINNFDLGATAGGLPPYVVQPLFNNYTFHGNTITVGNGVNLIYGHLQNMTFSHMGNTVASTGPFPQMTGFDASTIPSLGLDPSPAVLGAVAFSSVNNTNFVMEAVLITAGVGSNTIFGDFQNLTDLNHGGTATGVFPPTFSPYSTPYSPGLGPTDYATLGDNTFIIGANFIKAGLNGSGVNVVYGNLQDINFNNVAGVGNQPSNEDAAQFQLRFVLGGTGSIDDQGNFNTDVSGNKISVGGGVNTIYGNMRDMNFSDTGGVEDAHNASSITLFTTGFSPFTTTNQDNLEFFMGFNTILAGNGVNTVYGSMRDMNFLASGGLLENVPIFGTDTMSLSAASTGANSIISVSNNIITTGNGTNLIYGSLHDLSYTSIAGNGLNIDPEGFALLQTVVAVTDVFMGQNFITTGTGVNTIFGDFHNISLSASGGLNPENLANGSSGSALVLLDNFSTGNNIINAGLAGSSINTIYGDGGNVTYSVAAGVASMGLAAYNSIRFNDLSMGHNQIMTGNGLSTVYGDVQNIVWSATGGHADGLGSNAEAFFRSNSVEMGGNSVTVGSGNDVIYGDGQGISISAHGGTVTNGGVLDLPDLGLLATTNASAHMINMNITIDGNTINGGAGGDVIYSNLQNLSFSAVNGTVDGVSAGSVTGVGDASASFSGDINFPDGSIKVDQGSNITFGNDTIAGGAGNDTIIGSDVLNLSGLDAFLKPAGSTDHVTWFNNSVTGGVSNNLVGTDLNQINFGNELLTGGAGNDQFVFTMLNGGTKVVANEGNAKVTDFGSGDKVVLHTSLIAEHSAATLDADHVATFSYSGGNTTIAFSAGSIELDGVHYTSFTNMGAHLVVV